MCLRIRIYGSQSGAGVLPCPVVIRLSWQRLIKLPLPPFYFIYLFLTKGDSLSVKHVSPQSLRLMSRGGSQRDAQRRPGVTQVGVENAPPY